MFSLINQGGITARIFSYILIFGFLFIIVSIALLVDPKSSSPITGNNTIDSSIILFLIFCPIIFLEYRVRKFRKKHNFSIYKNISSELALLDSNINNTPNNDLNYWYELKEKGAISSEEYESKKQELLK